MGGEGPARGGRDRRPGRPRLAVGSDADVQSWIGPATRVVELHGRLVVPGFNDAHVHFLSGGFGLLSVDLRDARDEADFAARIGAHARTLARRAPGSRRGTGTTRPGPRRPCPRAPLIDAVTPDHPVFVQRLDGHMALANSPALRLGGDHAREPDPPGGTIVRDAEREPTGILKDNAADLVTRVIPEPSREMNLRAARAALKEAARVGVTTIQDNSSVDALPTYQDLRAHGRADRALYVWRSISAREPLVKAGLRSGLGDDWIRLGALKILSDGSMGSGTAAFFEPYADDPKTSGLLLYPVPELERMIREADAAGFQLAVHAIGDRANSLVLDAFEKAAAADRRRATAVSASNMRRSCARPTSRGQTAGRDRVHRAFARHRRHALGGESASAGSAPATPTTSARSWRPGSPWPSARTGSWSLSIPASASTRR